VAAEGEGILLLILDLVQQLAEVLDALLKRVGVRRILGHIDDTVDIEVDLLVRGSGDLVREAVRVSSVQLRLKI
jgi:hypothetical protein